VAVAVARVVVLQAVAVAEPVVAVAVIYISMLRPLVSELLLTARPLVLPAEREEMLLMGRTTIQEAEAVEPEAVVAMYFYYVTLLPEVTLRLFLLTVDRVETPVTV
jgi:hypothetical protein